MKNEPLEVGELDLKPAGSLVYVVYDWSGHVLYVGLTDHLPSRVHEHSRRSEWWPNAQRLAWELWPDRHRAARRESELIQIHHPPWNIHMNVDSRLTRAARR